MENTKIRTLGWCLLVVLAATALAGCMDDGAEDETDPDADDGEDSPSGEDGGEDGTGDDGPGDDGAEEDDGDTLPETELDTPDAWPMAGFDAAHTGSYGGPGDGDPAEAWSILTGGSVTPSVANAFVYTSGPGEDDARSTFHAFVPETGDEAWRYHAQVVEGSAVDADRIYIADRHGQEDTPTAVDAASGEAVWTHEEEGFRSSSAPALLGDQVFFGNGDTVVALEASTGEVEWEQETTGSDIQGVAQIMTDDERVLAGAGGQFFVFDAETGEEEGTVDTGWTSGHYTVADGSLFAVGPQGAGAWDLDSGEELWTYNPGQLVRGHAAVEDGIVYFGSSGGQQPGQVFALDAQTGDEEWVFEAGGSEVSPPAIAQETVYVATQADNGGEYTFQAIDAAEGTEAWSLTFEPQSVNPEPPSAPAYVDGMVFTNVGGFVVALEA